MALFHCQWRRQPGFLQCSLIHLPQLQEGTLLVPVTQHSVHHQIPCRPRVVRHVPGNGPNGRPQGNGTRILWNMATPSDTLEAPFGTSACHGILASWDLTCRQAFRVTRASMIVMAHARLVPCDVVAHVRVAAEAVVTTRTMAIRTSVAGQACSSLRKQPTSSSFAAPPRAAIVVFGRTEVRRAEPSKALQVALSSAPSLAALGGRAGASGEASAAVLCLVPLTSISKSSSA